MQSPLPGYWYESREGGWFEGREGAKEVERREEKGPRQPPLAAHAAAFATEPHAPGKVGARSH